MNQFHHHEIVKPKTLQIAIKILLFVMKLKGFRNKCLMKVHEMSGEVILERVFHKGNEERVLM